MKNIKVFIKDKQKDLINSFASSIDINELDYIYFQLEVEDDKTKPILYIEDYEVKLQHKNGNFISERYQFFRESFGLSSIRVFYNNEIFEYSFNVLAEKVTCEKAEHIIDYVYKKNAELLKVNFSRTTINQSLTRDENTNFEAFLDFSQSLINFLESKKINLRKLIKKKFIKKEEVHGNQLNKVVNPEEVLCNLDKLHQDSNSSDIFINGNYYSASGLKSESLNQTYDFNENRIILSSLIYTKTQLNQILQILNGLDINEKSNIDKEYSELKTFKNNSRDISKVILKVTSQSLIKRISFLLNELEYFIVFLKETLNIKHLGPINPRPSNLTKDSLFYKDIFLKIKFIYECGSFGFNDVFAKIKVRSMSKIYEFFCLYKLMDSLENNAFYIEKTIFDGITPKEVVFTNGKTEIKIHYEKIIPYIDDNQNSPLVSVNYDHKHKNKFNYYNPDFIISIKHHSNRKEKFYILDAKFRSLNSLERSQTLKELKTKYFDNIRYLDYDKKTLSNQNILGVFILYQGLETKSLYYQDHLKGFICLPMTKILPLYDDFNMNFLSDLISYAE